nr:hypothetical protein [Tanacetum cinerariifolium]
GVVGDVEKEMEMREMELWSVAGKTGVNSVSLNCGREDD